MKDINSLTWFQVTPTATAFTRSGPLAENVRWIDAAGETRVAEPGDYIVLVSGEYTKFPAVDFAAMFT